MLYYLPDFSDEFLRHYVSVLYFHRLQEVQPKKLINGTKIIDSFTLVCARRFDTGGEQSSSGSF